MEKKLRLILGDQLNYRHSWYQRTDDNTLYVIMEMRQETDYTRHHAQKIIGFFAAMYNFAQYLQKKGHRVLHIRINDSGNAQSLAGNLGHIISREGITRFEYQLPDEYRVDEQLKAFCGTLSIPHAAYDTEHFYTGRNELAEFFSGKQTFLMERFYRHMRKKHGVLMAGQEPEGGQWNFDEDNRKPYKGEVAVPEPLVMEHDYTDILEEIKRSGASFFGDPLADRFPWPTTRKQSLQVLQYFLHHLFEHFGTYEDAMVTHYHSLFHSRLSFALNTKMIGPREVVDAAVDHWKKNSHKISLAQCEGFVRQVLGWREYMRGVYWAKMPGYESLNFFGHGHALPSWFWTGETRMNCMKHVIGQSLGLAYAHHIQRLMVTGNFALLAGIHPDEVDDWYLGIYIDALQWVEITNTRGMSQFADGGIVGSKPYVASANYIDKMSNYCKGCFYDKKTKLGEKACPFNSLYWDFYIRHRSRLEKNPRIGMMYKVLDRMSPVERSKIVEQAGTILANLDRL